MKSMLYIGATLMIGASIYGFVDYKNTSHKKEFRNLYDEKESITPVIPATTQITDTAVISKPVVKEKTPKTIKKEVAVQKDLPVKEVNAKNNKEKRLSYKLFSRAPLDRRYLDKEFNSEELRKSEPAKIIPTDSLKENKNNK